MWIGKHKRRQGPEGLSYGFNWDRSPIEFLGVKIDSFGKDWIGENYRSKIDSLSRKLSPWLRRSLTPYGRIHLVKSEALSQLTYLMTVLPKPNAAQIKEIESIIFRFVWRGKPDRIKRSTLKNTFSKGGMKMPDIVTQAKSLKIKWVKQYISGALIPWKSVMHKKLAVGEKGTESISLFHCRLSGSVISGRGFSQFWMETLAAWKTLSGIQRDTEDYTSADADLSEVIWHNRVLKIENKVGGYKTRLTRAGVFRIEDLYDAEKERLMTSIELTHKYNVGHFLVWHSILSSIPREWILQFNKREPTQGCQSVIMSELRRIIYTVKWAYSLLLTQAQVTKPAKAQAKWQQELGISLQDDAVWSGMFTTLYKVTDDFKLKWLQMRIFHRILPTARLLHLYGVTDTDTCTFCKAHVETIGHLFWYCRKVNAFWRTVTAALMPSQTLSLVQVIMNVNPSGGDDNINLLIILLGKQYIWRCRNFQRKLSVEDFKRSVKEYYDIEIFIARINDQTRKISERWIHILSKL